MIRYKIYQNQQKKGLNAGKWFARAVSDETFDLAKLAEHMSKHNSPYSSGVIKGVLTDMVDCIKELLLDGKSVKIDDLAIFGVGIRSKAAETLEEFSLEKNITGMRLKARATGNLSTTNLKLDSQLKQQAEYQKPTASGGGSDSAIRLNRTRTGTEEKLLIRESNLLSRSMCKSFFIMKDLPLNSYYFITKNVVL